MGAVGTVLVEGVEGVGGTGTFGVLRLRCAPLRMTAFLLVLASTNTGVSPLRALRSGRDDGGCCGVENGGGWVGE